MVLVLCMGVFECVCVCGSEGWREGGWGEICHLYHLFRCLGGSHAVFFVAYVIWVGVFFVAVVCVMIDKDDSARCISLDLSCVCVYVALREYEFRKSSKWDLMACAVRNDDDAV